MFKVFFIQILKTYINLREEALYSYGFNAQYFRKNKEEEKKTPVKLKLFEKVNKY